jgi:hypothetical protein
MKLFSYIHSQSVHCWCIEKLLIFFFFILYPSTLVKLLMVPTNYLEEFFGFFRYKFMSSANRNTLATYFPICIPFIYSSCLIALAKNSKTMLDKSGKSRHHCLISDFRGNDFSFSPLSMILALGLSYIAFIILRYIAFMTSFIFIIKGC